MQIIKFSALDEVNREKVLCREHVPSDIGLKKTVSEIISQVRNYKDKALFEYTAKFDQAYLSSLMVEEEEYAAIDNMSVIEREAIILAAANIRSFHEKTFPQEFEYKNDGIILGKIYRPIEKVGLYIPGGTASLVSTLLMLAVPALIAGCKTKVLVTPPNREGKISPAILFAAKHCNIDTIYKIGGAQAIAALAFGTETIPKVYKIFGPGNKYVTEAKLQVAQVSAGAAFDMPAGPSEVLVIADKNANPHYIASDLLAQAEHDSAAQAILLTDSDIMASRVQEQVSYQLKSLLRKDTMTKSLQKSNIIIVDSLEECFNLSNRYAPEHLILHLDNAKQYLHLVTNAGSVFLGEYSPEAAGDYATGTNHVLPTYGYAKMYSGLDTMAFMKCISFQQLSKEGLNSISSTITTLASIEGLDAHKNAITIRLG